MNEIVIELKYNENDEEIILDFNTDDEIKIDISEDVNLTECVNKLTFLIEKEKKIKIKKNKFKVQKLQLIQNTIVDILTSFNEVIEDYIDEKNDLN